MAYPTPIPEKHPPLDCEEWMTMLADALDGTLPASDGAAFHAHKESCMACAQMLEEARRGSEWLEFLQPQPEVPADLLEKILSRTGAAAAAAQGLPALAAGPDVLAPRTGSWFTAPFALIHQHAAESRLLMTVAMAFFSIAFTLNLVGIRLNQLRLANLKPSTLATSVTREYYSTSARVMRYYESIRFVYEVESRVNELRGNAEAGPENSRPRQTTQPSAPSSGPGGNSKSGGGGAARIPHAGEQLVTAHPHTPTLPARSLSLSGRRRSSRLPYSLRVNACTPHICTRDQAKRSLA